MSTYDGIVRRKIMFTGYVDHNSTLGNVTYTVNWASPTGVANNNYASLD